MPSSYPIPFQRTNLGPATGKNRPGFMNDGTCTNPCDPNTMGSQGITTNGIYNPKIGPLPDGTKLVHSKVPNDWGSSGPTLNKAFYSFGSRTNIRDGFALKVKPS